MCAALARRLLQSLCGFLLNLILRLPWRQAAPAGTCDLGPNSGNPAAVTPSSFSTPGVWWGTAGSGAHSLPTAADSGLHPAPCSSQSYSLLLQPARALKVNQHRNLQLSRARGRGTKAGDGTDPTPQPRTCRVREGMRNSRQRGKDKGHKDSSP